MDKKGVDLSINVIIVAAIALAVLVILFAIVTGRLGNFTIGIRNTDTCKQKCDSLNMKTLHIPTLISTTTTSTTQRYECSNPADTYIAGKYQDGENGCCCGP